VNGYLTVNGEKMSKSRGTFIQARTYLDAGLNPEFLRYYFATMLTDAPVDIDLDLKAFEERVNSHLVGKFVNIASRCAGFIEKFFDGHLASTLTEESQALYDAALDRLRTVVLKDRAYERGDFAGVTRALVESADVANGMIAQRAPWLLAKEIRASELSIQSEQYRSLHDVATLAINWFRLLGCFAKPILPSTGTYVETFVASTFSEFKDVDRPLLGHRITPYEIFLTRANRDDINKMIEASRESMQAAGVVASSPSPQPSPAGGRGGSAAAQKSAAAVPIPDSQLPIPSPISIDDFAKLDLRIATVLQCGFVEGSDKLLRFELDAGKLGKRQIFSGIRAAYQEPEKLVGRKVVFIANLAPRKMRFGVSEGMILSAGSGGDDLFLLDVDDGAAPGMPVK
jgi:methionyl-tRNA synthetase